MKKIIIFLLAFTSIAPIGNAQIRYKCTQVESASKRVYTQSMVKARDGIVVFANKYSVSQPRFGYYLISSKSTTEFKEFPQKIEKRRIAYHSVKKLFDKHYIFFSAYNPDRNKAMVFYREFNVHSRQMSDQIFHLTDVRVSKKAIKHDIKFDVKESSDGVNMLLTVTPIMTKRHWVFFEGKADPQTPMFFVFDKDLQVINYRRRLKMRGNSEDVPSGKYEISSFIITSRGDLIALGIEPEDDLEERNEDANSTGFLNFKKKKKLRTNKKYLAKKTGIFVFPVDNDDFVVGLKLDSLYINSYKMFKIDGEISLLGTYAKDKRHASHQYSNGIFSSTIELEAAEAKLRFGDVNLMPFSESFIADFKKINDYKSWYSKKRKSSSSKARESKRRKKKAKREEKKEEKKKEKKDSKKDSKKEQPLEGAVMSVIELIQYNDEFFLVTEHHEKKIITETYTTTDQNGAMHTHVVTVPYFLYYNLALIPVVNSSSVAISDATIIEKSTFTRNEKVDKGYQVIDNKERLLLHVVNQLIEVDVDNQKSTFTKIKEIEAARNQYMPFVWFDTGIKWIGGSLYVPKFSLVRKVKNRKTSFALIELK